MKALKFIIAFAGLTCFGAANAVWTGPDGAACSGTLGGVAYSGVQRWSGNIAGVGNGSHYWTCCTTGTACGPIKYSQPTEPKSLKDRKRSMLDVDKNSIDQVGQTVVIKIDPRKK